MPDPLHNLNDLMEEIEGASIETSAGRYVRVDHIRRLVEKRESAAKDDKQEAQENPPPKTWEGARRLAAQHLKSEGVEPPDTHGGRSVPASDSQPPSRA